MSAKSMISTVLFGSGGAEGVLRTESKQTVMIPTRFSLARSGRFPHARPEASAVAEPMRNSRRFIMRTSSCFHYQGDAMDLVEAGPQQRARHGLSDAVAVDGAAT